MSLDLNQLAQETAEKLCRKINYSFYNPENVEGARKHDLETTTRDVLRALETVKASHKEELTALKEEKEKLAGSLAATNDRDSQHRELQNLLHGEFKKLGYDPNEFWDWPSGFSSINIRIRALSDALRDAISTYGPKDEIVVTTERQEAWQSVLDKYGA